MSVSYLDNTGLSYFWGKIKTYITSHIPTKTSDLTNDSGYITGYTETDPTVPSWAKVASKPTYTASEVGADASGTAASAVSAHNNDTTAHADIRDAIPTNVSDLTNDAGYTTNTGTITGITMNGSSMGTSGVVNLGTVITSHQDISGKLDKSGGTMTGALTLNADPTSAMQAATKQYVDNNAGGGGDMTRAVYDTDESGVVDEAESVTNAVGIGAIEFGLDTNGKGVYRAVGASSWIPFLDSVSETLVWTNPSPKANFTTQTITLSESLELYDAIKIVWAADTDASSAYVDDPTADYRYWNNMLSYTYDLQSRQYDPSTGLVNGQHVMQLGGVNYASSYIYVRRAYFADATTWTQLFFGNAVRGNSNSTLNSQVIPMFIYGVKYNSIGESSVISPKTENDVNFFDYDGTLVDSYSASEFADLTALPSNPSHKGLTAQGWNWTLADAKSYVANYGYLNIGQMYVTDDGKTRYYITIPESEPDSGRLVTICYAQSVANGVTIDWGDGSATYSDSNTSATAQRTHTYSKGGDYIITLEVTSGNLYFSNSTTYGWCGANGSGSYSNLGFLRKAELGNNVTGLNGAVFRKSYYLSSITIPNTVSIIGSYAFAECPALNALIMPSSVGSVGDYALRESRGIKIVSLPPLLGSLGGRAFIDCSSLTRINIPPSVTTIPIYLCSANFNLKVVTIPSNIGSIGNYAFSQCYHLQTVILSSGTSLGTQSFGANYSLTEIDLPNTLTTIGTAFANNYLLHKITIPSGVTSITTPFGSCYSLREIHLLSTTPPTISTSTFSAIPSDAKIYVPYSADHSILEAYKTASNWSTYASYIVEESQ